MGSDPSPLDRDTVAAVLEKLGDTVVRDGHGVPLVLHHGTFEAFSHFTRTKDVGFHFGSRFAAEARRRYAPLPARWDGGRWRRIAACLKAARPLVLSVDPISWTEHTLVHALGRDGHATLANTIEASLAGWYAESRAALDRVEVAMHEVVRCLAQDNPGWYRRAAQAVARRNGQQAGGEVLAGEALVPLLVPSARRNFPAAFASIERPAPGVMAPLRNLFVEHGYDSICYRNAVEAKRERGFSWCVFSDEQIVRVGDGVEADVLCDVALARDASMWPSALPPVALPADVRPGTRDPQNSSPGRRDRRRFIQALARVLRGAGLPRPFGLEPATYDGYTVLLQVGTARYEVGLELDWTVGIGRLKSGVPGYSLRGGSKTGITWDVHETPDAAARAAVQAIADLHAAENTAHPGQEPGPKRAPKRTRAVASPSPSPSS